jgi:hypothetical protein
MFRTDGETWLLNQRLMLLVSMPDSALRDAGVEHPPLGVGEEPIGVPVAGLDHVVQFLDGQLHF